MKIQLGILGCGYIAARHALHIMSHPRAELKSAFDLHSGKTESFCSEFNIIPAGNFDDFRHSKEIDIMRNYNDQCARRVKSC